jgi:hypothetical protein
MGYRSDVLFATTDENVKKLFLACSDKAAVNIAQYASIHKRDDWTLFSWSDVKWYSEYAEVDAVEKFVDTLDEGEYEFHVMGEEHEDYTVRGDQGNSPFGIYLSRELNFDP